MHKQWKSELDELRLTDRQKSRMKQALYEKKTKTSHPFIRLVLPTFVGVALFMLWLSIGVPYIDEQNATQQAINGIDPPKFTLQLLMWTLSVQFLAGLAMALAILVSKQLPRLQQYAFWRFVASLVKPNRIFFFIVLIVLMNATVITIAFNFLQPIPLFKGFIILGLLVNVMLVQLLLIRHNKRVGCPHCGEPIPIKQFFKITALTCLECQEKLRVIRKDSVRYFLTYYASLGIGMLIIPMLDVSFWYVFFYFITLVVFVLRCILPYTTSYEKDDSDLPPPLW